MARNYIFFIFILHSIILSNVNLFSQNNNSLICGINVKAILEYGYYFNDLELPPPYENWLDNFTPPNSSMQLSQEDNPATQKIDVEFEPFIKFRNISLSLPFNNIRSTLLATTYLDWHNKVPVNRLF